MCKEMGKYDPYARRKKQSEKTKSYMVIIDRNFKAPIVNMYENLWENIVLMKEQMDKQQHNRENEKSIVLCLCYSNKNTIAWVA